MRYPTWVCSLAGAVLIGGSTWIAKSGSFTNAGEAAGFYVGPILIGAGLGWIISKMQGVDPKYQKSSRKKEDTP